jgi:hypothetical protein
MKFVALLGSERREYAVIQMNFFGNVCVNHRSERRAYGDGHQMAAQTRDSLFALRRANSSTQNLIFHLAA